MASASTPRRAWISAQTLAASALGKVSLGGFVVRSAGEQWQRVNRAALVDQGHGIRVVDPRIVGMRLVERLVVRLSRGYGGGRVLRAGVKQLVEGASDVVGRG